MRSCVVGDKVHATNFSRGPAWVSGVITASNGPVSYTVEIQDGRTWKRHVDHVRGRSDHDHPCTVPLPDQDWDITDPPPGEEGNILINPGQIQDEVVLDHPPAGQPKLGQPSQVRQSSRQRKAPSRFGWDN